MNFLLGAVPEHGSNHSKIPVSAAHVSTVSKWILAFGASSRIRALTLITIRSRRRWVLKLLVTPPE